MSSHELYEGRRFPLYPFSNKIRKTVFFEFEVIFRKEFWIIFRKFLERKSIGTVVVENILPEIPFKENVNVHEMPESLMKTVHAETLGDYFPSKSNFHLIANLSLIYPGTHSQLFCLILDRKFELAMLGITTDEILETENNFDNKNSRLLENDIP